jgi:hypothetical protein
MKEAGMNSGKNLSLEKSGAHENQTAHCDEDSENAGGVPLPENP